jgi:hypothetical protein
MPQPADDKPKTRGSSKRSSIGRGDFAARHAIK